MADECEAMYVNVVKRKQEKSHSPEEMTLNGLAKIMLFQRLKLEVRVRLARFRKLRFVLLQEI